MRYGAGSSGARFGTGTCCFLCARSAVRRPALAPERAERTPKALAQQRRVSRTKEERCEQTSVAHVDRRPAHRHCTALSVPSRRTSSLFVTHSRVLMCLCESSLVVILLLLLVEFGTGLTRAVRLVRVAGRVRLRHGGRRMRGRCDRCVCALCVSIQHLCSVACNAAVIERSGCLCARCATAETKQTEAAASERCECECIAHPNGSCSCA